MTFRTFFTRPYQRIWNDGVMLSCLVGYGHRSYLKARNKTIQREYVLYINLWLVQFKISWLGKMREPK